MIEYLDPQGSGLQGPWWKVLSLQQDSNVVAEVGWFSKLGAPSGYRGLFRVDEGEVKGNPEGDGEGVEGQTTHKYSAMFFGCLC